MSFISFYFLRFVLVRFVLFRVVLFKIFPFQNCPFSDCSFVVFCFFQKFPVRICLCSDSFFPEPSFSGVPFQELSFFRFPLSRIVLFQVFRFIISVSFVLFLNCPVPDVPFPNGPFHLFQFRICQLLTILFSESFLSKCFIFDIFSNFSFANLPFHFFSRDCPFQASPFQNCLFFITFLFRFTSLHIVF